MLKKMATLIVALVATVLAFGTVAVASTAATAPKTVGVCAKTVGGTLRLLEPKNVARSQYGRCKTGETRVLMPTTLAQGPKGVAGAQGVKGDVGPAGVKGDAGATGLKGDVGPAGKDGANGRGFDGAPFNMTFAGEGPWSCSWVASSSTLACVTPAKK